MKHLLLFCFLLTNTIKADTQSLKFKGDQAHKDGFDSVAWGFYEDAYKRAAEKDKMDLLTRLARSAPNAQRLPQTVKLLQFYIDQAKAHKADITSLAPAYLNIAIMENLQQNWPQSLAACQTLLANADELPKPLLQQVLDCAVFSLVSHRKYQEASQLIKERLDHFANPEDMELQNARLNILLGRYISAFAILDKFTESQQGQPHFLTVWAYMKAGELEKALEVFKAKLKNFKEVPDPVYSKVLIKLAESTYKKYPEDSFAVLDQAYALEKDKDLKAYLALKKGELMVLSSHPKAIDALKFYVSTYPNSSKTSQAYLQIASLYKTPEKENLEQAEFYCNKVLEKAEQKIKTLYRAKILRGQVRRQLGRSAEAAEDFIAAATLAKENNFAQEKVLQPLYLAAIIRFSLAAIKKTKEDFLATAKLFQQISSYESPFRASSGLMLAQALRQAGRSSEAVHTLQLLLQQEPQNRDALFLLGISQLEAQQAQAGVATLQKFIHKTPKDNRVAIALAETIAAALYQLPKAKGYPQAHKFISYFEKLLKDSPEKSSLRQTAPAILHFKAILNWKQNNKSKAAALWHSFLQKYPKHSLGIEARLWLSFTIMTGNKPDYKTASSYLENALEVGQAFPLRGAVLLKFAESRYEQDKFKQSLKLLEEAAEFFKQGKNPEKNRKPLAHVLFFTGEVYSRLGKYQIAVKYFTDCSQLYPEQDFKNASEGRIADCYFSSAGKIKGEADQLDNYIDLLTKAKNIYLSLYKNKDAFTSFREQALYKLAKCHEGLALTGEKAYRDTQISQAVNYLSELFFDYKDNLKKGQKLSAYYFCRSGYDLARLHLSYAKPSLSLAINVYATLKESQLPGTAEAALLEEQLRKVQQLEEE